MSVLERSSGPLARRRALGPARATPAAARLLFALLERMAHGEVLLTTPDGALHAYGQAHEGERAEITFKDWRLPRELLMGGDVAFGQAYMDGRWDTPDLVTLLVVLARNQQALGQAFLGHPWQRTIYRLRHWLRANTKRRSRRNVMAHYDLGNDFYRLWLDPSMTYSSALFEGDAQRSLAQAQQAKYRRILEQLCLPAGAHILEIGCGWGGFAELAGRTGYRVTGISLSEAQTQYARERIAGAGLSDRVALRIQDYRDVRGRFDGVVSIEMIEAVGERWWPAYFRAVRSALAPGARACIQAITIADERFEGYRSQSDFIQQFIFPGGMLASPSRLTAEARGAGLEIVDRHAMERDYARTLIEWLANFDAQAAAVRAAGFGERFERCWRFYLAYCAAGFMTGSTGVAQYTLAAGERPASGQMP
jgi:cyclopropane-fatty-acyl-phospholipid synthase